MFQLDKEQLAVQASMRQLAREYVLPRAAEIDESEEYPEDIFKLLREHQLLGLPLPREYGGAGASIVTTCVVVEEFAKICYNTAYILTVTFAPFNAIWVGGSEAQKARYLHGLATGELRGCVANTEPEAGSDTAAIRTRATSTGDGWYTMDGTKRFATNAELADFFVVSATLDPALGRAGITNFVVDRGTPGLTVGKKERKMGGRGIPTCELYLDGCRVHEDQRLGAVGAGQTNMLATFGRMRPVQGSRGVGLAQGALDYAVGYAQQRVQFGRPIAKLQGLRFMMADMAIQVEAARNLTYHAASLADAADPEAPVYGAMCKCFAADTAMRVAVDAAQVLGGYGILRDYPLERYIRDAKLLQIVGGTTQIQRVIVSRWLLND